MPTDTWYGSEVVARIGIMADKDTDPTAWEPFEFASLTFNYTRERRPRPMIGQARNNVLDPTKPRPGFEKLDWAATIDLDTRYTPRMLRYMFGAPATSGPSTGIYTHVWSSGAKAVSYFAIQIQTASGEMRVYRGLTGGAIALPATGENTQDFTVNVSGMGISRAKVTDWLSGTVASQLVEAPVSRVQFLADGTAVTNTLEASWSWDRNLVADTFLSATPVISGIRPGQSVMQGSCRFRAMGAAFDTLEEGDTVTGFKLRATGTVSGDQIDFEHGQSLLDAAPVSIPGVELIERAFSWSGHQSSSAPAAKITVANHIASYAS